MKSHLIKSIEVTECKYKKTHMCSIIAKPLCKFKTGCFLCFDHTVTPIRPG